MEWFAAITAIATAITAVVAVYILLRRTTIGRLRSTSPNQVMLNLRGRKLSQIVVSINAQSSTDKEFFITDFVLTGSLGSTTFKSREWVRGWDNHKLKYRSGFSISSNGSSERIFFLIEDAQINLTHGRMRLNAEAFDAAGETHNLFEIEILVEDRHLAALAQDKSSLRFEWDRPTATYLYISEPQTGGT